MARIRRWMKLLVYVCVATSGCSPAPERSSGGALPGGVSLTWLSVSNWLLETGDTRILLDGYVTRIDRGTVNADGTSTAAGVVDTQLLASILDRVLPDRRLDWVLVGHGHWDHAFDTPGWARLTGARVGGARTVCHQVVALGIDASRCTALEGGEVLEAGPVRVRVVRWHHSGDSATANGRRLRAPLELRGPPPRDPATGGLRPGYLEDYPNGGGSRAYLIRVQTPEGPLTLFWSNTGNPQAWDAVVPADSTFFREQSIDVTNLEWAVAAQPALDALSEALRAENLDSVDLWLGFPNATHVVQVAEVLRPRVFIPHHWDDFWESMLDGLRGSFRDEATQKALDSLGVQLVVPASYFARYSWNVRGVTEERGRGRPSSRAR